MGQLLNTSCCAQLSTARTPSITYCIASIKTTASTRERCHSKAGQISWRKVKNTANGIEPTASPQSLIHHRTLLSTGHLKSIEHCRHQYTEDTTDDDKRHIYADKRLQKTIFVMSKSVPTRVRPATILCLFLLQNINDQTR